MQLQYRWCALQLLSSQCAPHSDTCYQFHSLASQTQPTSAKVIHTGVGWVWLVETINLAHLCSWGTSELLETSRRSSTQLRSPTTTITVKKDTTPCTLMITPPSQSAASHGFQTGREHRELKVGTNQGGSHMEHECLHLQSVCALCTFRETNCWLATSLP